MVSPSRAALLALASLLPYASAYQVAISDTDSVRQVCSGMYGGKQAYIELAFDTRSSGQVAMVIYEWSDVEYLGKASSQDDTKTYICSDSAIRSGLCDQSSIGTFITTLPEGKTINQTSIFTTALQFTTRSTLASRRPDESSGGVSAEDDHEGEDDDEESDEEHEVDDDDDDDHDSDSDDDDDNDDDDNSTSTDSLGLSAVYSSPITYAVAKTGYYCVGIVPVTLVEDRMTKRSNVLDQRDATHAEYSGTVLFRNTFQGQLPAVEYPKINFYLGLGIVYFVLGCAWGYLCFKYRDQLLPMQFYISGTIVFLVIEMLANFAYYRFINKHGGGTSSLIFLFVVATLNAARNSLSFFLLLIVSMGLSVVRPSLGSVMTKVRILTGVHFVFSVLYAVGTVEVELDRAPLLLVLVLILPLALTLTAFLMWIIISLNGTILFLQAHKQRMKLQMFQRLWRILILGVIAIAAFFVVSSMSLSNRFDEDYAPNNWRYRWILLDGSLAIIYLVVFSATAYIWRPTRNNISFSMSQELAQDEADADAEDYEIDNLESGLHRPLRQRDSFEYLGEERDALNRGGSIDEEEERKKYGRGGAGGGGGVGDESVVFALHDDSDGEGSGSEDGKGAKKDGYKDIDDEEEEEGKKPKE